MLDNCPSGMAVVTLFVAEGGRARFVELGVMEQRRGTPRSVRQQYKWQLLELR